MAAAFSPGVGVNARCAVERPRESLDAIAIEDEQRPHARHVAGFEQRQAAIVEHDPFFVDVRGDDGMVFAAGEFADDDEPHIVLGDAGFAQRHVFGDGVVLAIAAAARRAWPAARSSDRARPTGRRRSSAGSPY